MKRVLFSLIRRMFFAITWFSTVIPALVHNRVPVRDWARMNYKLLQLHHERVKQDLNQMVRDGEATWRIVDGEARYFTIDDAKKFDEENGKNG